MSNSTDKTARWQEIAEAYNSKTDAERGVTAAKKEAVRQSSEQRDKLTKASSQAAEYYNGRSVPAALTSSAAAFGSAISGALQQHLPSHQRKEHALNAQQAVQRTVELKNICVKKLKQQVEIEREVRQDQQADQETSDQFVHKRKPPTA